MDRYATLAALLVLAATFAVGCIPTDFDSRRGEASTVVVEPPEDYPTTRFGSVVTGYSGMIAGQFGSRVAGSAGVDTPFAVYSMLFGTELRLDTLTIDGCDTETPCQPGASASLVGMSVFRGRSMCVATAAMGADGMRAQIKVRCEDDVTRFEVVSGPIGERFGFAGTGLRTAHPFGFALYGAPGALGGGGGIYRLGDSGDPSPLDLSMGTGVGRGLGRSVAIGVVDADTVLVAGGAPVGADKRVIVATVDIDAGGAATTSVRGCMDATTRGYGEAIAIGDFDGDGLQDVAIGSGAGAMDGSTAPPSDNLVHIHSGASMPAPGSCANAWPETTALACPTVEGIDCDDAANFGASLAVGDVNADGIDDLIVGAPLADVDGVGSAGAVYVFPGNRTLTSLDEGAMPLVHSSPSTNMNLGFALATVPGQDTMGVRRDEVVAGAPGANRVYVFLCTGIDGDGVDDHAGSRCQPLEI